MAELVWALATLRAGFVHTPDRATPVQRTNSSLQRRHLPAAAMAHIMLGRRQRVAGPDGNSFQAEDAESAGGVFDDDVGGSIAGLRGLFDDEEAEEGIAGPGPGSLHTSRMAQRSPFGSRPDVADDPQEGSRRSTLHHRSSTLPRDGRRSDVTSSGAGPGPGAAAWAGEGRGSPLAWAELQRCAGLALMAEISQQRRHTSPCKSHEEGTAGGSGSYIGNSYGGGSVAEVVPAGRLGVRALSRVAHGFAVAGRHDAALFRLIEDVALGLSGGLPASDPGALACLAYAFARAGVACPRLMPLVSRAFSSALRRHPVLVGSRLPLTGGSPSITGAKSSEAGDEDLAAEASGRVAVARPSPSERGMVSAVCGSDVARLMWAMAALQLKDSELLHTLCSVLPGARFRSVPASVAHNSCVICCMPCAPCYRPPASGQLLTSLCFGQIVINLSPPSSSITMSITMS